MQLVVQVLETLDNATKIWRIGSQIFEKIVPRPAQKESSARESQRSLRYIEEDDTNVR